MRTTSDQKKVARVSRSARSAKQRATASAAGGRERRLRSQQIRTKVDVYSNARFKLGGWLSGRGSYLWFGENNIVNEDGKMNYGRVFATVDGPRLYRLAKAIVRHFESDKRK